MKRAPLVAVLAVCAALPASATASRPSDFELAPPSPAAQAADGKVTSKALRAPKRFNLVGFRWAGGGEPEIELRTRAAGGRWSRWTPAAAHEEHAPDPRAGEPGGSGASDPVWAGRADYVQYRLSRPLRRLRLHFVNAGTPRPVAFRSGARTAQSGAPAMVPRDAWAGADCPPRSAPSYGEVKAAFVHHTVSTNDYTPEEAPSIVLGICRFHRNSNGWDDIGYNFLVDKYGRLYEGRAGGIDQPVIGAQAQGFNGQTTSVANVGDHSWQPQSNEALDAMASLIRWKLPLHGQPTSGTVQVTSAGGASNRYPAATVVTLDRIPGHRDGNETACPGDALYAQLPDLRSRVGNVGPTTSSPQPVRMTINRNPTKLPKNQLVLLTGTIEPAKHEAWIRVERKVKGRYRRVAGVKFNARTGQLKKRFRVRNTGLYRFRFQFAGDAANLPSRTRWVFVRVTKPTGGTQAPDG